jgi:DNA-binding NarL/FixJ family response regulator
LRVFREKLPNTQILIFSGYQSPSLVCELLQSAAHGFAGKSAPLSKLRKGIEIVASGGSYLGSEVASLLRDAMADPKSNDSGVNILTKREREILQLIAESHSTRDIAAKLEIRVNTAENHRTNLMIRKFDLHDVASLTRYAINNGIISRPLRAKLATAIAVMPLLIC